MQRTSERRHSLKPILSKSPTPMTYLTVAEFQQLMISQCEWHTRRECSHQLDEVLKPGSIPTRICEGRPAPLRKRRCQSISTRHCRFNRHTCAPIREPITTTPAM